MEYPRFTHKDSESLVTASGSAAEKLPVEVWSRIGDFITSPSDLVTLASISQRAMGAAADIARYPWVENFRLVDVVARGPVLPIPETTTESVDEDEMDPDENILHYFYELGRRRFTALDGGRRADVELGQHDEDKTFAGSREISFGVENSYFRDCVGIALYILELDDD